MHDTVMQFVKRVITAEHVAGKSVLEVGSCDVNGSVRPHIETLGPSIYLGVDAQPGPRVDMVLNCEHLSERLEPGSWELVISTEMLEHVLNWRTCMEQITAMIAPGGHLLLTTRSPGFPYHGFPDDHWRYTRTQMLAIMDALYLQVLVFEDDPQPGVMLLARRPPVRQPSRPRHLDDIVVDRVLR
jgi:Methyltransferase domain